MRFKGLLFFIALASANLVFAESAAKPAWVEPLFGPEFTFSRPQVTSWEMASTLLNRCRIHLIRNQSFSARFKHAGNSMHFESPNGWNFTICQDQGVAEVKMAPQSLETFKKYESDVQDAIFASAANENLYPYSYLGGGHISISWETFKNNLPLLRNFLVDLYNHGELFMGIFGYDTHNALPVQMTSARDQEKFLDLIEMIDRGRIDDVGYLRSELATLIFSGTDELIEQWSPGIRRSNKYYAVNLLRLDAMIPDENKRIEIRAVRPQASFNVFIRQISLLRNRIRYLYNLEGNLLIQPKIQVEPLNLVKHKLNPPVDPQAALRAFYEYVTESGERWTDHRDYVWPAWIESGELRKFEATCFRFLL